MLRVGCQWRTLALAVTGASGLPAAYCGLPAWSVTGMDGYASQGLSKGYEQSKDCADPRYYLTMSGQRTLEGCEAGRVVREGPSKNAPIRSREMAPAEALRHASKAAQTGMQLAARGPGVLL